MHCSKLLYCDGLFSYGTLNECVIPCLEFSMEFQFNGEIKREENYKNGKVLF
tara:strand:+ start:194 stop:349 length:156 start_codon:yes stop_codon:yes gene_type:complete